MTNKEYIMISKKSIKHLPKGKIWIKYISKDDINACKWKGGIFLDIIDKKIKLKGLKKFVWYVPLKGNYFYIDKVILNNLNKN